MDMIELRRRVMLSMASGVWKQKRVTVQNAIAWGGRFANLIANNLPTGVTFALIVKDNLDPNTFINNQLVHGAYDSVNSANNVFCRYRNSLYSHESDIFVWSDRYALTASAGDTYTILYQQ